MEQVGPQADGAAEVVRDDMRTFETPVLEQVGEQLGLRPEIDRMLTALRRLP